MTHHQRILDARYLLIRLRRYVASAVMALRIHETPLPNGAMAVDSKWNLYYDPQRIEDYTPQQIAAVLYHEIWHLLGRHHERLNTYPPEIANAGGDLAINSSILREGLSLPGNPLVPATFGFPDGKSAEWYADALMQQSQQLASSISLSTGGGSDDKGDGSGGADGEGDKQDEGDGSGNAGSKLDTSFNGLLTPDHGSCAHGRPQPYEVEGGLPSTAQRRISRMVAEEIVRQRGTLPDNLVRWAEAELSHTVDWTTILRSAIRSAVDNKRMGRVDYTWNARSRRQGLTPVILPALRAPDLNVVVIVDTSGSMNERDLSLALSEIKGILDSGVCGKLTVCAADAEIHTTKRVFSVEDVELIGGGGTSMRTAVHQVMERSRKSDVDLVIIITDGHTDWPDNIVTMVAVLVDSGGTPPPDYIQVVDVTQRAPIRPQL